MTWLTTGQVGQRLLPSRKSSVIKCTVSIVGKTRSTSSRKKLLAAQSPVSNKEWGSKHIFSAACSSDRWYSGKARVMDTFLPLQPLLTASVDCCVRELQLLLVEDEETQE